MQPLRRRILFFAYNILDLLLMSICFLTSYIIVSKKVSWWSFGSFLIMKVQIQHVVFFLGLLLIWHFSFSTLKLYNSYRLSTIKKEIIDLIKASTLGTALIYLFSVLFAVEVITPAFIWLFWWLVTSLTIIVRGRDKIWIKSLKD